MRGKFKPGESGNPKGRPRGSKNIVPRSSKEKISSFLNTALDELPEIWKALKPREKSQLLRDLIQFEVPKLQSVAVEGEMNIKGMTNEQADLLAQRIYEYGKDHK
jgi:hypothetical protein